MHHLLFSFPSPNSLDIPRSREAKAEIFDVDSVGLQQMYFLLRKAVRREREETRSLIYQADDQSLFFQAKLF